MKAHGLINDNSVQVVIEAESSLEMGLLKRMVTGKTGNGHSLGAGYGNSSSNYGHGYDHISIVVYDAKSNGAPIIYQEIKGEKYVLLDDVLRLLNPDKDAELNDLVATDNQSQVAP